MEENKTKIKKDLFRFLMIRKSDSKNAGITLIALVITVIILLILAGITISSLTNSGLFDKVKEAKGKWKNAQDEENAILANYEEQLNIYSNGGRSTPNSENTMSAIEHFTGQYYFNGKPIYAQTFYISALPSSISDQTYTHGIQNVDEIWFDKTKSFIKWSDGRTNNFDHDSRYNTTDIIVLCGVNRTEFIIGVGEDRSSNSAYVTLNYTKTTDTGNGTTIPDMLDT